MGRASLLAQGQALLHAKAVLLVDDGQPQALEIHPFLDQGMGAHHQAGTAGRFRLGQTGLALEAAGEPGHLHPQGFEPGAQFQVMLFGQDFRGRHEGGLPAGFDGLAGRQGRHQGLARPHIPLEQALHGIGLGQIGTDLGHGPLLGPGQGEGQGGLELAGQGTAARQQGRADLAPGQVGLTQGELLGQQLIELDALPGRMVAAAEGLQPGPGRGRMQGPQGLPEVGQALPGEIVGGQDFRQGRAREGFADQPGQGRLGQAGGGGVDGSQGLGQGGVRAYHPEAGVHHLRAEEAVPHFTAAAHPVAGAEGGLLTGIETQEAQHQGGAAVADMSHQLAPGTKLDLGGEHFALHLHGARPGGFGDGGDAGFVLVAQGQMQQQVLPPPQSQAPQLVLQPRGLLAPGAGGRGLYAPRHITASASTRAPLGSSLIPTAARAG